MLARPSTSGGPWTLPSNSSSSLLCLLGTGSLTTHCVKESQSHDLRGARALGVIYEIITREISALMSAVVGVTDQIDRPSRTGRRFGIRAGAVWCAVRRWATKASRSVKRLSSRSQMDDAAPLMVTVPGT